MKNRLLMYIGVFFSTLLLSIIIGDPFLASIIFLGIFTPSYIGISLHRQKKRIRLLEEDCDPEAFLAATEKQYQITGKNKTAHIHLMIDKSAGLASMGRFEEALELLLSLDYKRIKRSNIRRLVYCNNLMLCYDNLNQTDQVTTLYKDEFMLYSHKFRQFKYVRAIIYFAKLKYENYETHEEALSSKRQLLSALKEMKLSKRLQLHLKLFESELALMEENYDLAVSCLKGVIAEGNKLHIVEVARERLMNPLYNVRS